jgi:aspartate aminotransferase
LKQISPPPPAERSRLLGFSDIVKIRNRVMEMKGKGEPVIELQGGEPFSPTPEFIKDAMKAALDRDFTRYAPSSGIPQLLHAISEKLTVSNSMPVLESDVIVVSGGAHGLFCAFQAALDPGDETILFSPYWTPIHDLVVYSGATPVRIPWWDIRNEGMRASLRKRISPKTKVIYVNTPSNPTGKVLVREQLEEIAEVALERNLIVISDEAYEDLVYDGRHVSIGSLPEMAARTISVFTLSKSYAMTGCRIGYVSAGPPFMDVIRKLVLNSVNGISTPTQFAAVSAISQGAEHIAGMLGEYRQRRDLLYDAVSRAGLRAERPEGAFYLFADVRERLGGDSWAAMNALLERTGIATVPGAVFGPEGEGHLRMSYSNSLETLERAAEAFQTL